MFVFEMFEPSLIMRLRSVCFRVLSVHILRGRFFFFFSFFRAFL